MHNSSGRRFRALSSGRKVVCSALEDVRDKFLLIDADGGFVFYTTPSVVDAVSVHQGVYFTIISPLLVPGRWFGPVDADCDS